MLNIRFDDLLISPQHFTLLMPPVHPHDGQMGEKNPGKGKEGWHVFAIHQAENLPQGLNDSFLILEVTR